MVQDCLRGLLVVCQDCAVLLFSFNLRNVHLALKAWGQDPFAQDLLNLPLLASLENFAADKQYDKLVCLDQSCFLQLSVTEST